MATNSRGAPPLQKRVCVFPSSPPFRDSKGMVVESEEANNTERLAIVPAVGEKTRNEKKERLGAEEERQAVGEERERERGVKSESGTQLRAVGTHASPSPFVQCASSSSSSCCSWLFLTEPSSQTKRTVNTTISGGGGGERQRHRNKEREREPWPTGDFV